MTRIIIFTDFDGTLTKKTGLATVETPFYKSLFVKRLTKQGEYRTGQLKKSEEIQRLFKEKFDADEQTDTEMLIAPEAIAFFRDMLQLPDVAIYIVTKNRAEYIRELLIYQGFSEKDLTLINIYDSCYKGRDVSTILASQISRADFLFFIEDSEEDCKLMVEGAKSKQYSDDQMIQYVNKPGNFQWNQYQEAIETKLKVKNETLQNYSNHNFFKDQIKFKALTTPDSVNQDTDLTKPEI
ncbi:MAG TPA: hypothetical protein PK657_12275 [Legionella sp.]|nr:hypothetical protein [Legionella sp.]